MGQGQSSPGGGPPGAPGEQKKKDQVLLLFGAAAEPWPANSMHTQRLYGGFVSDLEPQGVPVVEGGLQHNSMTGSACRTQFLVCLQAGLYAVACLA
jgi:hypothetical protein